MVLGSHHDAGIPRNVADITAVARAPITLLVSFLLRDKSESLSSVQLQTLTRPAISLTSAYSPSPCTSTSRRRHAAVTYMDRKRIIDALDKHLQSERSSPSTSRAAKLSPTPDAAAAADELDSDSEGSDVSASEGDDTFWITWFCNLRGNEFFSEIDDDYVQDDFNLCGLSNQVPYYDHALDLILDVEPSPGDVFTEEQNELIESSAEMLYGLIHARYILTTKGLAAMLEKFKNYDFGRCPRVSCCGQPCLPAGQSDIPRSSTVKIYCPKCEDLYYPRSKYQGNTDGAYFGTTFPHLFLMANSHLKPQKPSQRYIPRVFGFKVNKKS